MFESPLAYVIIDSKGHYIVEEYVDKVINKYPPNQPWQVSLYFSLFYASSPAFMRLTRSSFDSTQ